MSLDTFTACRNDFIFRGGKLEHSTQINHAGHDHTRNYFTLKTTEESSEENEEDEEKKRLAENPRLRNDLSRDNSKAGLIPGAGGRLYRN